MIPKNAKIAEPKGKLGILLPGMGAVSTTFITGVEKIRKGTGRPFGSLTQMGNIRLGKRTENRTVKISDLVPLASLDDLVFGGWDPIPDNAFDAAMKAGVLKHEDIEPHKDFLSEIKPMTAVFDKEYVKLLDGPHVKKGSNWMDLADQVIKDIDEFKTKNGCDRMVMLWAGSTEIFQEHDKIYDSLSSLEKAMKDNNKKITPSMIYAYAAMKSGIPYANGAPNVTADIPAFFELAAQTGIAHSGKDFKTGQTLMKTIVAPGIKARMLGMNGWFSTNILGNRDGEVLDDPQSFRSKEVTKGSVLNYILQPDVYPELYKDMYHKVRINYYPPLGDNKEGWDNIDIFGWLGYPMQIKINFLCRDSILAAPIVLDLVLFMDLAARCGATGLQEWLSFYFKSPTVPANLYPEHDIFIQLTKLKNTLRHIAGEELITHLGTEYYEK